MTPARRALLDDLWRDLAGLPPVPTRPRLTAADLDVQWSPEFERLMRNRLEVGACRYGAIGAPGKPQYDRVKSIRKRLDEYERTGNKELLVDGANLFLLEFVECHHPLAHFRAVDDGEHVEVK